ncbi:MAG: hypothetical protein U0165_00370 [Polyangiaceae bacterium]
MIGVGALPIPALAQVQSPMQLSPNEVSTKPSGGAEPPPAGPAVSAPPAVVIQPAPAVSATPIPDARVMPQMPVPSTAMVSQGGLSKKTMLGVAMPGIAPIDPAVAPPSLGAAPPTLGAGMAPPSMPAGSARGQSGSTMVMQAMPVIPPGVAVPKASAKKTLMGIAFPSLTQEVEYVEETYEEVVEQTGRVEKRVRQVAKPLPPLTKRPWFLVLIGAATLAVAAGVVALLLPNATPIVAEPKLDAVGKEVLHVTCASCPDGTRMTIKGGASSISSSGVADLALPVPLKVGPNRLEVEIDRPSSGRDENVTLDVPLAYRIWPDLTSLQEPSPSLRVLVEATPGSSVTVQGKPVALDAQGKGAWTLDVADQVAGPSEETRPLDRQLAYTIAVAGGKPVDGSLTISHLGVVPLVIDSPGATTVIETGQVVVAGRSIKGAAVTINGNAVSVGADGTFLSRVDVAAVGNQDITIRSSLPPQAPRTVRATVRRVASLSTEAREYESKGITEYSGAKPELAGAGKLVAWKGEIAEAATRGGQTVLVLNVGSGCAKTPCVARVVVPGGGTFKSGERIKIYGHLTGGVSGATGWVPAIEADFILRGS